MAANKGRHSQSIKILNKNWRPLVDAVSMNTMAVADRCLSHELLISDDFYGKMASDDGRHNEKSMARKLLVQIKTAIRLNEGRFDKFVHILKETLPGGKEEQIVKSLEEEGRSEQSIRTKSMNSKNHNLKCKNFGESDLGNQGVRIQEETVDGVKYDRKIIVGVTIGDIQGKQEIQREELTVKRGIKGTGKDVAGVAIGDLSNQGIQEETVRWDIKGIGKGTTGVAIGNLSNHGIQEETVKWDIKGIGKGTTGVAIGDLSNQGIQEETVKWDIKGIGKGTTGVAIGDLSNQGIQEETVKWDIKGIGKGTTGVAIGDLGNHGIQEETVKWDTKGMGKGTTRVTIGDLSNQGIQEGMVKQDIKGTGRDIAGITIICGNDRSSVIMAKKPKGYTYRIDTVFNIRSISNQRKTMYQKKQTQCQLKYEDMDNRIMLSTKAVPRDHSYELSQWQKKDHIRKQCLLLITFIMLVVEVLLLFNVCILMAFIVGLMLAIGLIMFYKVNAGKESQDKFRYEVSLFIEHWRKQDNLQNVCEGVTLSYQA